MSRKTLADELAELANPAPTKEFDPEVDIFGSGPTLEASDDELIEVPKSKGKERSRIRAEIQLPGKEYAGRRSSRAAVFEDSDGEEESEEEEEREEEEDITSGSEEEDVLDDGEEITDEGESEEEESSGSESDGGAIAKGQVNGFGGSLDAADDEAAALEREYREMQQQEANTVAGLHERAAKEQSKGLAVRAQRGLWDSGLELRILLQKALQCGNRLPQTKSHRVASAVDPEIAVGLSGLARDAAGVMEDLLSLLSSMEEQHPAIGEAADAAGVKRKRHDDDGEEEEDSEERDEKRPASERLWKQLDEAYERFIPFRDASIDRWHRKTVLSSGSAARGGLKALNQSVSSQVQMLMRDSQRVVQRTRLPKRHCTPLCSTEADKGEAVEAAERADALDQSIAAADEVRDPETYDDGEFYQTLLKEFFEGKQEGGANWYSGPKQRKLVDRRASKGRKLRYHIHEKLANFMAPVELNAPQFASNVFANLFGGAGRK